MKQKEIKAIKKNICENGASYQGYYCSIKDIFSFDEIIEAVIELENMGIRLDDLSEAVQDDYLITEIIKMQSYQEFKNKTLNYIFH